MGVGVSGCTCTPTSNAVQSVEIRPLEAEQYRKKQVKSEETNNTSSEAIRIQDKSEDIMPKNKGQSSEGSDTSVSKDDIRVQDVPDDAVDPSLNIAQTERLIERKRRASRMESEAVTKQKLLSRLKSHEAEQEPSLELDDKPQSPTELGENLDHSLLNPNEVENKLSRSRRDSQTTYQHKLSIKRESRSSKKKMSVGEEEGVVS